MDNHHDITPTGGRRTSNRSYGEGTLLIRILLLSTLFCFTTLILPGCSPKIIERVVTVTETKDSLIVRDRIIHDTVRVEIPIITERIVTPKDSSHLENAYAVSDAYYRDGFLYHSLSTKPQVIDVPVDVHVSDTTTIHETSQQTTDTHVETQYVEKKLSWWQKCRIGAFWWLLGGLVACLVWIFRKPLLSLLKKFV